MGMVQVPRRLLPLATSTVPAPLLRVLATSRFAPRPIRVLSGIADALYDSSRDIWEKKKQAAMAGHQINQIGEGKDIMSHLRA